MPSLADRTCVPCRHGDPPLASDRATDLLREIPDWSIVAGRTLHREFRFPDFARALAFVNEVGALAEAANHHPDVRLSWGKVSLDLSTHDVGGLSENDFVLAARIDRQNRTRP